MITIRFLAQLLMTVLQLPLYIFGIIGLILITRYYYIGSFPRIMRWFDSVDPYINRDVTSITNVNNQGWFSRWYWVAIRNPLNYFNYKILGFQSKEQIAESLINDTPSGKAGYAYIQSQGYYEYIYIYKWSNTACLKIEFGWKLSNTAPEEWVERCFIIQPYKKYSGQ